MSSHLYTTYKEYSRVHEELSLTEEGVFIKDREPADYGGPIISIYVVHIIHMVDASGVFQTLEFHNEPPLNKDKSSKLGVITIDGSTPAAPKLGSGSGSGGDARTWVTKMSTSLPSEVKKVADTTFGLRSGDAAIPGALGSP